MAEFNELFTSAGPRFDVAFIVEERHVYMNKTVLGLVSPVFQAMFEGDYIERSASEIPLPGKLLNDVLEFFHAIFPSTLKPVDGSNFEVLLSLADEYQVDTLKARCEHFAVGDLKTDLTQIKLVHYMHLAEKHNWTTLLDECITKSKEFVFSGDNSLSSLEEFNQLSADTKYKISSSRLQCLEPSVASFNSCLLQVDSNVEKLFGRKCSCYPNEDAKICSPCLRRFETLTREFSETFSTLANLVSKERNTTE